MWTKSGHVTTWGKAGAAQLVAGPLRSQGVQEASGGSESQYLLFVGFSGLDTSVVPQFAAWGRTVVSWPRPGSRPSRRGFEEHWRGFE